MKSRTTLLIQSSLQLLIPSLLLSFMPALLVADGPQPDEIKTDRGILADELVESDLAQVGATEHTDKFGNRKIQLGIHCKKPGSDRIKVTLYDRNGIPNSSNSFDIECKNAGGYSTKDIDFYRRSKSFSIEFVHRKLNVQKLPAPNTSVSKRLPEK